MWFVSGKRKRLGEKGLLITSRQKRRKKSQIQVKKVPEVEKRGRTVESLKAPVGGFKKAEPTETKKNASRRTETKGHKRTE